ncbi:RVP_2 domain-containing protein [Gossypium australe]|uniref:RVP_2 domain-containing protein n=1 Tax=Gossypium australe TaxID=47621 RepID=A0A5B6W9K8_9ROSI|nr:RVP_2 domain-containing protein [Gossypium australe]
MLFVHNRRLQLPASLLFDVILGIDWLNLHDAVIDCRRKRVDLRCPDAYILDSRVPEKKIDQVSTMCEFSDVFPKELSGLPPEREVEFVIELAPGIAPILITPYRMAPTDLKELKAQLQELTNRGFI